MKNALKILCCTLLFVPSVALAAGDTGFSAQILDIQDTSVTIATTRMPLEGEFYSASCSPYTGKEEYSGFTKDMMLVIPNLTKGVFYTCTMNIFPSAQGGYVQGTSQPVMFVAGEMLKASTLPKENRKPTIQDIQFADGSGSLHVGEKVIFTVTAVDPDFDPIQFHFFACKENQGICTNAMNDSPERWTAQQTFAWTPPTPGSYQLQVAVRDGLHAAVDNPFGDHEMTINFDIGPRTINPFPDTDLQTLSGQAAAELAARGIIGGYPDGEFKGQRLVNRAEAAKFLLLARDGKVGDIGHSGRFMDIPDGQWFTKYIHFAAAEGIIEGYSDGSFRAGNTINTAEFLKMLARTFGLEENLPFSYTDVPENAWYARYAGAAQKYDLFPDRKDALLPGKEVSRTEMSIAIYQYFLTH